MPVLKPPFDPSVIPPGMASLPLDPRGYPIPWFAGTHPNGERDLRFADAQKRRQGYKEHLCWICGGKLGPKFCFIGGPLSVLNRCFGDWASHRACAEFAVQACPAINGILSRRRRDNVPEGTSTLPGQVNELPDLSAIYVASGKVIIHQGLFIAPWPRELHWYLEGEKISKASAIGMATIYLKKHGCDDQDVAGSTIHV